jgi:hypothetical protein
LRPALVTSALVRAAPKRPLRRALGSDGKFFENAGISSHDAGSRSGVVRSGRESECRRSGLEGDDTLVWRFFLSRLTMVGE